MKASLKEDTSWPGWLWSLCEARRPVFTLGFVLLNPAGFVFVFELCFERLVNTVEPLNEDVILL